jgi:hypothetical protein
MRPAGECLRMPVPKPLYFEDSQQSRFLKTENTQAWLGCKRNRLAALSGLNRRNVQRRRNVHRRVCLTSFSDPVTKLFE